MMSFSDSVKKNTDKMKDQMEFISSTVLFDLGQSCIFLSPVDTGRFRSNWRFEIGKTDDNFNLDESVIENKDKTLGRLKAKIGEFVVGESFYITNNVPYAIPLEYGHSEQRPEGMVRQTAELFDKYVKNAILASKKIY